MQITLILHERALHLVTFNYIEETQSAHEIRARQWMQFISPFGVSLYYIITTSLMSGNSPLCVCVLQNRGASCCRWFSVSSRLTCRSRGTWSCVPASSPACCPSSRRRRLAAQWVFHQPTSSSESNLTFIGNTHTVFTSVPRVYMRR